MAAARPAPHGYPNNPVQVSGKVSMDEVTRGVVPFVIAEFLLMFPMVLFPQSVTVPASWFH